MKNMIFIFSIVLIFSSCNDDDSTEGISLYNKWSLVKFEPGFSPMIRFSEKEIIWEFQRPSTLKVEIDNSISSAPIKSTGKYRFLLDDNHIIIDNLEYDFSINDTTIIISDNPSSDGFKATFSILIEE